MSDSSVRFVEIADRCWTARLEWLDVNVSVVAGDAGLVVIDTGASDAAARRTLDALRTISMAPVIAAVNTHHHFDHTFGNAVLADTGAELICHDEAASALSAHAAAMRAEALADPSVPEHTDLAATTERVPGRTFSSALALDLGDRQLELLHPGKGHTSGDIVVRVPDADVMFAGDLVEESALRGGVPGFGDDCWPMDWPRSMDLVIGLLGPDSVVVPGHGAPVDIDFVQEQRVALGIVAETIRDLASRGVPSVQALEKADWPYPREELALAVRRGYAQLPRHARGLPLI